MGRVHVAGDAELGEGRPLPGIRSRAREIRLTLGDARRNRIEKGSELDARLEPRVVEHDRWTLRERTLEPRREPEQPRRHGSAETEREGERQSTHAGVVRAYFDSWFPARFAHPPLHSSGARLASACKVS